jgi:hypothetical protein
MKSNKKREEDKMEWWKQKWVVLKVLTKYFYLKLLQTIYITVVHLNKNTYEIQYALHDKIYKIRTHARRGPSKIVRILDHVDNDITEDVRTYMGPNEDFHGQSVCPQDIGYERVCICLRNGDQIGFASHEPIVVK